MLLTIALCMIVSYFVLVHSNDNKVYICFVFFYFILDCTNRLANVAKCTIKESLFRFFSVSFSLIG